MATITDTLATPTQQRSDTRRWIALIVVCLAMLMNALDSSIVTVALPKIQHDLGFSQSSLTWVVNAYMIAFGAFLLLAGRLGDLVGRKKVFLAGVAIFTLASIACAAAPNGAVLIVARFLEGLGGAVSTSVIVAIIVTEFPSPSERARAMNAYMLVGVGGGSAGLIAGGVLTQLVNWHWIFLINVPIGVLTIVAGWFLIEENDGLGVSQGIDLVGSALVTIAMLVGIYGIVNASSDGWLSAQTLATLGAGLALLAGFLWWEATVNNPIMPLRIFAIRSLAYTSIIRGALFSGMYGLFFLGALYIENIGKLSPLATGVAFLPMTGVIILCACGVTTRLLARFGPMKLLVPGMAASAVGLFLAARIGTNYHYASVMVPVYLLLGFGMGITGVPLMSIAMADVPVDDAGLASGITNVSMWMSGSLGLAVLGSIAADRTKSLVASGVSQPGATIDGYQVAFVVAGCCAAVALALTIALLRDPARRLAEATAAEGADGATAGDGIANPDLTGTGW